MKNVIKKTVTVLAAATTLIVSGASMTASAACHAHGQFIYKSGSQYSTTCYVGGPIMYTKITQTYQDYNCGECKKYYTTKRVSYSSQNVWAWQLGK